MIVGLYAQTRMCFSVSRCAIILQHTCLTLDPQAVSKQPKAHMLLVLQLPLFRMQIKLLERYRGATFIV